MVQKFLTVALVVSAFAFASSESTGRNYEDTEMQRRHRVRFDSKPVEILAAPSRYQDSSPEPQRMKQQSKLLTVVKQVVQNDYAGNYNINYQFEDGTGRTEEGHVKLSKKGKPIQTQSGSVSYKSPEGIPIEMKYTADENGFRPVGSHLPTPPPTPEAILKMLAILPKLEEFHEEQESLPLEEIAEEGPSSSLKPSFDSGHGYYGYGSAQAQGSQVSQNQQVSGVSIVEEASPPSFPSPPRPTSVFLSPPSRPTSPSFPSPPSRPTSTAFPSPPSPPSRPSPPSPPQFTPTPPQTIQLPTEGSFVEVSAPSAATGLFGSTIIHAPLVPILVGPPAIQIPLKNLNTDIQKLRKSANEFKFAVRHRARKI